MVDTILTTMMAAWPWEMQGLQAAPNPGGDPDQPTGIAKWLGRGVSVPDHEKSFLSSWSTQLLGDKNSSTVIGE